MSPAKQTCHSPNWRMESALDQRPCSFCSRVPLPSTYWIGGSTTNQCILSGDGWYCPPLVRPWLYKRTITGRYSVHIEYGSSPGIGRSRNEISWELTSLVVVLQYCCIFRHIHPPTRLRTRWQKSDTRIGQCFPSCLPTAQCPTSSTKHHCYQRTVCLVLYGKRGKTTAPVMTAAVAE